MICTDLPGWSAAVLTLLTFASRDLRVARLVALGANACFIGYAATNGLMHVLALHLTLAPINRSYAAPPASSRVCARRLRVASATSR